MAEKQAASAKHHTQSGLHVLPPFSPHLPSCGEIKKSTPLLSIFPCREAVIQNSLPGDGGWRVCGLFTAKAAIPQRAKILKDVSFCLDLSSYIFPVNVELFFLFFFVLLRCSWLLSTDAPPVPLTIFNTHLSSASPVSLLPHLLC